MRFNCQLSIYTALVPIVRLVHRHRALTVINRKNRNETFSILFYVKYITKKIEVFILNVSDLYPYLYILTDFFIFYLLGIAFLRSKKLLHQF